MSRLSNKLQYLLSALAALIGVQSHANREKDFKQKSAIGFILTGIILLMIFILGLIMLVKLAVYLTSV
ncbi:DUF2970 domain-containing protein [Catenovulum sp. 2E275]|uniref:DUF2970 domain-containing protein n=1 Tax=Catenovulum sp. 2E275 TaxID=2980497 RepID=UPI0021D18481|nr:DUF2970 domain-containing protein [Catenovulum sp. 2E275]MCU4675840.1 DUF2970 domain-containing protein [Catenovulum sp. 2E275]